MTDYRPISVCNVIYKVISKIIARRLKPIIPSLIYHNQVAFTRGRNIAHQIILMREIMHTFKRASFNTAAFCLKSDLSKAFDRMSWVFIERALTLHAFPPTCKRWIMACVRSACFTILFQGQGDVFITPTRGIRQGCALSPYIFIICMNILSALLIDDLHQGRITGLRLSRSAIPLTNLMYADDLLLLGRANRSEVRRIHHTLQLFCQLSGQKVSPEKCKLWFSKNTSLSQMCFVLRAFGASFAEDNETYLGAPVDVSRPSTF